MQSAELRITFILSRQFHQVCFYINHEIVNRKLLDWQDGYGVVSFGTRDLAWVIEYVKNQKEHHAKKTTIRALKSARITKAAEAASHTQNRRLNQP